MSITEGAVLTVMQPGEGDSVPIPGFGAVFKLTSKITGALVAIVKHPFAVGTITAAHRHTHEDEHASLFPGTAKGQFSGSVNKEVSTERPTPTFSR